MRVRTLTSGSSHSTTLVSPASHEISNVSAGEGIAREGAPGGREEATEARFIQKLTGGGGTESLRQLFSVALVVYTLFLELEQNDFVRSSLRTFSPLTE